MKKWLGHPAPVLRLEATATTVIDAPVLGIAGAAIYFASEASSFTTGAVLQVDGGMVI